MCREVGTLSLSQEREEEEEEGEKMDQNEKDQEVLPRRRHSDSAG